MSCCPSRLCLPPWAAVLLAGWQCEEPDGAQYLALKTSPSSCAQWKTYFEFGKEKLPENKQDLQPASH